MFFFFHALHKAKSKTHYHSALLPRWRDASSWQTHLKFIESLYSRSEAEVANIAGKRRLPVLIDKKWETFTLQPPTMRKLHHCSSEQISVSQEKKKKKSRAIHNTVPLPIEFEKCVFVQGKLCIKLLFEGIYTFSICISVYSERVLMLCWPHRQTPTVTS